jgi:hypothetical protein
MKFEIKFFPTGRFTGGPEAYVCAKPVTKHEAPDPLSDHIVLTHECINEFELQMEVDRLIADLQKQKAEGTRMFEQADR